MIKFLNPNILDEGNQMVILEDNDDLMKVIVRCNNCGQPTEYGMTRMCSGFVGCDNKMIVNGKEVECYFGDLQPRVIREHDKCSELYKNGKLYRWRDNWKDE